MNILLRIGGTDDKLDAITDLKAYITEKNNQSADRKIFTDKALKVIANNSFDGNVSEAMQNTSVTGHSLGGNHAQETAYETGMDTYTYNAFGTGDMIKSRTDYNSEQYNKYGENITNVRLDIDTVSKLPYTEQYGQMITIPSNVAEAVANYLIGGLPKFILNGHSIDNLLDYLYSDDLPSDIGLFLETEDTYNWDLLSYFFNPFDENWDGKFLETAKDFWSDFGKNFFSYVAYDPIVLDLDGNGIAISENTVYFDHNGDRVSFQSDWIDKNDGILVFDRNKNGIIDDGSELFGNFTP